MAQVTALLQSILPIIDTIAVAINNPVVNEIVAVLDALLKNPTVVHAALKEKNLV